jgi:hypothetical protein
LKDSKSINIIKANNLFPLQTKIVAKTLLPRIIKVRFQFLFFQAFNEAGVSLVPGLAVPRPIFKKHTDIFHMNYKEKV